MSTYADIIFDQGDEAAEVINRLERIVDGWYVQGATEETIRAAVEHLKQWEGDTTHRFFEWPNSNAGERSAQVDDYILTWHIDLGYVSLGRLAVCEWFALCDHPAVGTVDHPILGAVPACERCITKQGLPDPTPFPTC